MSQSVHPATRNFLCDHCGGEIRIPYDLPPVAAPCPHCSAEITSPPPPHPESPEDIAVAPPEEPEVDFASKEAREKEKSEDEKIAAEKAEAEKLEEERLAEEKAAEEKAAEEKAAEEKAAEEKAAEKKAAEVEAKEKAAEERLATERLAAEKNDVGKVAPSVSMKEKAAPDDLLELEESESRSRAIPGLLFLGAMLILVGLVGGGVYLLRSGMKDDPKPKAPVAEMDNARFIRDGWKSVATEQLRGFLDAEGTVEKARFVIGGSSRVEEMEAFYSSVPLDESDTPLDAFGHHNLDLVDREAGVFLMQYERPAQFDIREFFRPVATLEVRYDLEQTDELLSSVNKLQYFAMDPVKAMAFFKREGDHLQLDWDTYVQTKHRTLKRFSGFPAAGSSGVFRVLLQEDIPDLSTGNAAAIRTYRAMDPGNSSDYVKIQVAEDSEVGEVISELNWIGVDRGDLPSRTATVELAWSEEEESRLELKRVICWEFLGLGGVEGNTRSEPAPEEVDPALPAPESAVSEAAEGAADEVEAPTP